MKFIANRPWGLFLNLYIPHSPHINNKHGGRKIDNIIAELLNVF